RRRRSIGPGPGGRQRGRPARRIRDILSPEEERPGSGGPEDDRRARTARRLHGYLLAVGRRLDENRVARHGVVVPGLEGAERGRFGTRTGVTAACKGSVDPPGRGKAWFG